jgi:hypothetical protein
MAKSYDELMAAANGARPQPSPYPDLLAMAQQAQARKAMGASGSWEETPAVDPQLAQEEVAEPVITKAPAKPSMSSSEILNSVLSRAKERQAAPAPASIEEEMAAPAPRESNTDQFMQQLMAAQQEQRNKERGLNMLEASQGFLKSGLRWGGSKNEDINQAINNEGFENLRKQAGAPVSDLQALRTAEKGSIEMGSMKRKDQQERDMVDSNSELSKQYREIAKQSGINVPENANAASLEKTLPWLFKAKESAMDRQLKQQEIELRKQEIQAKIKENAKKSGMTKGQVALDQQTAKEYTKWLDESPKIEANLSDLESVKEDLRKAGALMSGPIVGKLPKIARSSSSIETQQKVDKITTETLRQILGAQFTEKEGETIRALSYDPELEPEANIKKINDGINRLKALAKEKQDRMGYFENNEMSMSGYKGVSKAPQSDKVVVQDKDGKRFKLPKSQLEAAAKQGYTEVKE